MSDVVIGDILPRTQATATGGQTVFGTNWTANYTTDVVVYKRAAGVDPDDATQVLSPSLYTVAFIGAAQDVQVTLLSGATAGDIVTIIRQTPAARTNLYSNTNFLPTYLNNDFGILTLVDQQSQLVDDLISPRYNYSAPIVNLVDTILPILGANQFWAKDNANSKIIPVSITDVVTGGTVTEIDTGLGLTGGPITVNGTISMLPTLPDSIQLNITKLGSLSQALNMNTHLINNVVDPVSPQDAATKNYIDTITFSQFLPLIGGTMAGIINMGNHKITNLTDPSAAQDAVTLAYLNSSAGLGAYLPLSGGTMTGQINMGSNKIISLLDPTNPQDAATKNYVDTVATGLTVQPACYAATTAALTATYSNGASGIGATLTNSGALAAFATDGTSPPTNARILVWNQASTFENGIYTLTNQGSGAVAWVLTRSTDYDQPSEIQAGDLVVINNGTAYGGTSFIETANVTAIGTDPILFSQFTFSATAVLLKANNLSDVANTTTAFNNISPLTTKGDLLGYNAGNVRIPVGLSDGQILRVKSAASAGWDWSTATYPDTTTANQILFSSSTNTVTGLTSIAGGVLVTDNLSVPSFLANPSAVGRILQSANAAIPTWSTATYPSTAGTAGNVLTSDGTNWLSSAPADTNVTITDDTTTNDVMYPTWVTANTGTLPLKVTSTKLNYNPSTSLLTNIGALGQITNIQSSAGLKVLEFGYTASAVNYLKIYNATTGNAPVIEANGTDSSIGIALQTKNGNVSLVDSTSTAAVVLRFYNAAHNQYIGLQAGTLSASTTFTLPTADGTSGQVIQTNGSGALSFASVSASLPTGTQFNTQQGQLTSATTINSATFVSTGLTVNITPTSSSNKVLVRANISIGMQNATDVIQLRLYRGATPIGVGDAAGVRTQGTSSHYNTGAGSADITTVQLEWLDSPATTSATTYAVYALTATPTAFAVNRTWVDTNTGALPRVVSTITVCEVKV